MYKTIISLHDRYGNRKYLNQIERERFFEATKEFTTEVKLFAQLIYYTGARISEIHKLKPMNIDILNEAVIIESLKKRQDGVFREIPLPLSLLKELEIHIGNLHQNKGKRKSLWWFSLKTGYRRIGAMMAMAGVTGVRACSRGLRHGFAVYAVGLVPLTMVRKWLGHASLETTAIYLDVIGTEEREFARRIWGHD